MPAFMQNVLQYNLLPWQWAAWIALGLAIGFTKAGFGGILAVIIPVVATIFGARETSGLILPVLCFTDIIAVIYYRKHAEWKYIVKLLPWSLAGFAVAILADKILPVQAFRYLLGSCILGGLVVMVWNDLRKKDKQPPSSWWFSAIFGIAGGFSTMIGNAAGAIMAVFLLSMRLPKNSFVGTTVWYFMIINLLKIPIQVFIWKNISSQTLLFSFTLIPIIILGIILGIFLIKKISETIFRRVIMVLTLMSTIVLLAL